MKTRNERKPRRQERAALLCLALFSAECVAFAHVFMTALELAAW